MKINKYNIFEFCFDCEDAVTSAAKARLSSIINTVSFKRLYIKLNVYLVYEIAHHSVE